MGIWFLATSMGNYVAGRVAGFYQVSSLPVLFGGMTVVTALGGLVLWRVAVGRKT
jgi:dipeptide/tripeptide permease